MSEIRIVLFNIVLLLTLIVVRVNAQNHFTFKKNTDIPTSINENESEVVFTALEILNRDIQQVFRAKTIIKPSGKLIIGTIGLNSLAEKLIAPNDLKSVQNLHEGFILEVQHGKIIILGSDKRGTAYGILEISRLIGVSPWEWWADSPIATKQKFILKNGFKSIQSPSVKYRGIFINDEDWGLTPWSSKTHEPTDKKGTVGPKTHARIFELLLRLRANTYWPPMHDCSVAFYLTPGNKQMADHYGIYIGTSHCEPMMCNTNAEWKIRAEGNYNYLTNKDNILKFWESRTRELSGSDNIFTLGIRGVHDGKMVGANTIDEQKIALTQILNDQRDMIRRIINPDVEKVSQVFIPYKEVLDVYNAGLKVPEDVTLMWTDDNYGYINHFPDSIERNRKGGNGIYYHLSYWGRPHDYLWLSTTHPAQIYYQLKLAYNKGAQQMWIINVGDIKPAEYQLEMIMDMAWNINSIQQGSSGFEKHLKNWLIREFGKKHAYELLSIMKEHYRLAYIRKPEFMGNTRTEEKDPKYKIVSDLAWSDNEITQRISDYQKIENQVIKISNDIPASKESCWFQLIEYPVRAAIQMNKKLLYAQLARHAKISWTMSDKAYNEITTLTNKYNNLNNGKWKYIMSAHPRDLAVFNKVSQQSAMDTTVITQKIIATINGADYHCYQGAKPIIPGFGYQNNAICINKNTAINYTFKLPENQTYILQIALAPNHPVNGKNLRFALSVDDCNTQIIDYSTQGRSEEWKLNVLNNQAIRQVEFKTKSTTKHTITIKAIDEGVVLDQIKILKQL